MSMPLNTLFFNKINLSNDKFRPGFVLNKKAFCKADKVGEGGWNMRLAWGAVGYWSLIGTDYVGKYRGGLDIG